MKFEEGKESEAGQNSEAVDKAIENVNETAKEVAAELEQSDPGDLSEETYEYMNEKVNMVISGALIIAGALGIAEVMGSHALDIRDTAFVAQAQQYLSKIDTGIIGVGAVLLMRASIQFKLKGDKLQKMMERRK